MLRTVSKMDTKGKYGLYYHAKTLVTDRHDKYLQNTLELPELET